MTTRGKTTLSFACVCTVLIAAIPFASWNASIVEEAPTIVPQGLEHIRSHASPPALPSPLDDYGDQCEFAPVRLPVTIQWDGADGGGDIMNVGLSPHLLVENVGDEAVSVELAISQAGQKPLLKTVQYLKPGKVRTVPVHLRSLPLNDEFFPEELSVVATVSVEGKDDVVTVRAPATFHHQTDNGFSMYSESGLEQVLGSRARATHRDDDDEDEVSGGFARVSVRPISDSTEVEDG